MKTKVNWLANTLYKDDKKGTLQMSAENRASKMSPKLGPAQLNALEKKFHHTAGGDVEEISSSKATDAVNYLLAVNRDETTKEMAVTGISEECIVVSPSDPPSDPPEGAVEIRLWSTGKNSCCHILVDGVEYCVPC